MNELARFLGGVDRPTSPAIRTYGSSHCPQSARPTHHQIQPSLPRWLQQSEWRDPVRFARGTPHV